MAHSPQKYDGGRRRAHQGSSGSRNEWPLGRVTEAMEGEDGLVRKVKLNVGSRKLDNKRRRKAELSVLERPIQKVILLLEIE